MSLKSDFAVVQFTDWQLKYLTQRRKRPQAQSA